MQLLILFFSLLFWSNTSAQTWTWVSGERYSNDKGVYGEINASSSQYKPAARAYASSAVDSYGNMWIFGGTADTAGFSTTYADLWKFDGSNWILINGNNATNVPAVYSGNNTTPGSLALCQMWIDSKNTIWIFGGTQKPKTPNELWKYQDSRWTLVKSLTDIWPHYGTRGEGTELTSPGNRLRATAWVDSNDYLWLFGGSGASMNDLWCFNGTVWTWISGSNNTNILHPSVNGTSPSSRFGAVGWKDPTNDHFWLFGGNDARGPLNDVWMFDGQTWIWIDEGHDSNDYPPARDHSSGYFDRDHFLLFGGADNQFFFCDVWSYSMITRSWSLLRDCPLNSQGVYDTLGAVNSTTFPGSRVGAVAGGSKNTIWIFGGIGRDGSVSTQVAALNDLWIFNELPSNEPSVEEKKTKKSVSIVLVTVIPIIGTLLCVSLIIGAVFFIKRRRNNRKVLFESDVLSNQNSTPLSVISPKISTVSDIVLGERLGGGQFGDVYRGKWQNATDVALKKLKSEQQLEEFASEANMLQKLRHQHVVQFYGIFVSAEGISYIVTEYLSHGSLDRLIQMETFSTFELLEFARDAAAGMLYLSQQKIIHRDLALRNLLVGTRSSGNRKYLIKIADFGMSKSLGTNQYYKKEDHTIPFRWSSPEVLAMGKYSTASDIWSFGVVLYELFSRGLTPYLGMSNSEVVKAVLDGQRLQPPTDCPSNVQQLMTSCWQEVNDRPSFQQIVSKIDEMIQSKQLEEANHMNTHNASENDSSIYLNS